MGRWAIALRWCPIDSHSRVGTGGSHGRQGPRTAPRNCQLALRPENEREEADCDDGEIILAGIAAPIDQQVLHRARGTRQKPGSLLHLAIQKERR